MTPKKRKALRLQIQTLEQEIAKIEQFLTKPVAGITRDKAETGLHTRKVLLDVAKQKLATHH